MNRLATASMSTLTLLGRFTGNPKRKTLLAFLIQQNDLLGVLAGWNFFEKGKGVFQVLPSKYSGSVAGEIQCSDGAGWVWGGIRAGFSISFWRAIENTHKMIKSFYDQSADLSFPKNVDILRETERMSFLYCLVNFRNTTFLALEPLIVGLFLNTIQNRRSNKRSSASLTFNFEPLIFLGLGSWAMHGPSRVIENRNAFLSEEIIKIIF